MTRPRGTGLLACRVFFFLIVLPLCASAQKFYTYVGDIGPDQVLIAWGNATNGNTIGRSSSSHGRALVRIAGQELAVADRNYVIARNLQPDTEYTYQVELGGRKIGEAKIRTWPLKSERLRFFAIGDWGSGDKAQKLIADAMWADFQKQPPDNPVRFVITTGDNLYGTLGLTLRFRETGALDTDWEAKFFRPYERLIARIPFRPSLGNHDGNETESRGDLPAYLDNFFFPGNTPGRYYRFSFGGLADFFALDSTTNSEEGPPQPAYLEDGDQHKWLDKNLSESQVPWKIPYFHHPPFNSGPRHPAAAKELKPFVDLFKNHGVKVVFSGHEHNFQFSHKNAETGDIRYVVSGAGGELRTGDVRGAMQSSQIEGWVAKLHYLLVEIEGKEMRITPKSSGPLTIVDRMGKPIPMPLRVTIP